MEIRQISTINDMRIEFWSSILFAFKAVRVICLKSFEEVHTLNFSYFAVIFEKKNSDIEWELWSEKS